MTNAEKLVLLNQSTNNYLLKTLAISFTELGEDYLVAKMPVNERVFQPDRVLHGGATFALAETVGSVASYLFAKGENQMVRGIEMSGKSFALCQQWARLCPGRKHPQGAYHPDLANQSHR